jgi:hypothetical protein
MDEQIERDILAVHAERLNAGLRGIAAYPPMTLERQRLLEPLMQLAERLYEVLVPVEPSPIFVEKLGQELALAAARSQLSLIERYRRAILVTAATLGSALSVIGLVLLYFFRQRNASSGTPIT